MPSIAASDRVPGKVPAASREIIAKSRAVVVRWDPPTSWSDGSTEGWDASEVQHYAVSLKRTAAGGGVTWVDDSLNKPYIVRGTRAVFPLTKDEAESSTPGFPKFAAKIKAVGWDNDSVDADTETGAATPEAITPSDGSVPASSPTPTAFGHTRSVNVQWNNVNNADPVVFELHMGTSSGFTPSSSTLVTEVGAAAKSTEKVAVTVTKTPSGSDLSTATTYYFKTRSKDIDGAAASYSAVSNGATPVAEAAPTTGQIQSDGITPSAPSTPTLTPGYKSILITWPVVTNTRDPLVYEVWDSSGSVNYGTTTAPAMLVNNLNAGSSYGFKVRAKSSISGVYSGFSGTNSATAGSVAPSDVVAGTVSAALTLTGSLSSPNTSGTRVEINVGGYPLRYWNGSTTWFSLDAWGNATFSGTITSGSTISGATFYTSPPTSEGNRIELGGGNDTLRWVRRTGGVDSTRAEFYYDWGTNYLWLLCGNTTGLLISNGELYVPNAGARLGGSLRIVTSSGSVQTDGGSWIGIGTNNDVNSQQNYLQLRSTGGATPAGDANRFTIWFDGTDLKGRRGTGTPFVIERTTTTGRW